jgi:hypothetical protein
MVIAFHNVLIIAFLTLVIFGFAVVIISFRSIVTLFVVYDLGSMVSQ